jgi:hypothetical protein
MNPSHKRMMSDRGAELAAMYLEGAIGPADFAELESLLMASETDRQEFLEHVYLDAHCVWDRGGFEGFGFPLQVNSESIPGFVLPRLGSPASIPALKLSSWGIVGIGAGVFGLLIGMALSIAYLRTPPGPVPNPIALVVAEHDVVLDPKASLRIKTFESVYGGDVYAIKQGIVGMTTDLGVALTIEGPAKWSLNNDNSVHLDYGKLVAKVGHKAIGFTVKTKSMVIVDLGTEFGVRTTEEGNSALTVFEGSVEATPAFVSSLAVAPITIREGESATSTLSPDKTGVMELLSADAGPSSGMNKDNRNQLPLFVRTPVFDPINSGSEYVALVKSMKPCLALRPNQSAKHNTDFINGQVAAEWNVHPYGGGSTVDTPFGHGLKLNGTPEQVPLTFLDIGLPKTFTETKLTAYDAFTICAWCNLAVKQGDGAPILAKGDGGGERFCFDVYQNRYRFFTRGITGDVDHCIHSPVKPNADWQFIAVRFMPDRKIVEMYVDGDLDATAEAVSSELRDSSMPVWIGCRTTVKNTLNSYDWVSLDGIIGELLVFDRAISPHDVKRLFEANNQKLAKWD